MATAFSFSPWSAATAASAAGLPPADHHHHHRRRRPLDINLARICARFERDSDRDNPCTPMTTTPTPPPPKFGDLTQYGISAETERRVWAAEVRRLAEAVTDPGAVQLQGPAEWYGGDADANGYGCLHDLAHAFQMALEICTHDDLIVASHHDAHADYTYAITQSYSRLERNFDDKIQRRKYEHLGRGGNRAFHAFVNHVTATVALVLLRAVDTEYDSDDDDDAAAAAEWTDRCLAALAQFASKIKVVGYDLPITTAISMAVFFRSQLPGTPMSSSSCEGDDEKDYYYGEFMEEEYVEEEENTIAPLVDFNQTLLQLLRDATATLLWDDDAATGGGQPSDMYETSAVLYDAGFYGMRRQLCQERSRRIGSSAGRRTVKAASVVFDVCRVIWDNLPDDDDYGGDAYYYDGDAYFDDDDNEKENGGNNNNNNGDMPPCRTYLDWSWTTSGGRGRKDTDHQAPETQRRSLANMRDVITALVPYTMFCGPFASTLARLVAAAAPGYSSDRKYSTPFSAPVASTRLASARIRTAQHCWYEAQLQQQKQQQKQLSDDGDKDQRPPHKSLYDTALAQERALACAADDAPADVWLKRQRHHALNDRLRDAVAQMDGWTIGPHAITINDSWYCQTTCAAIGLLVLGALSLILGGGGGGGSGGSGGSAPPLLLDRPNLVVLVWTAAGFLLAYIKSMRVEAWPWHDFFRGQVVCRSVSEVHAVTKMNPQTLLAALLWRDGTGELPPLLTSGPFCSLFRHHHHHHHDAAGGFDIDIAPLCDTSMAGGHLFVVVATREGPALIDLAPRPRGGDYGGDDNDDHYTAVPNVGSNTACPDLGDALFCINASGPDLYLTFTTDRDAADGRTKTKKMLLPMYRLSEQGYVAWHRVLGVLDERAIFR